MSLSPNAPAAKVPPTDLHFPMPGFADPETAAAYLNSLPGSTVQVDGVPYRVLRCGSHSVWPAGDGTRTLLVQVWVQPAAVASVPAPAPAAPSLEGAAVPADLAAAHTEIHTLMRALNFDSLTAGAMLRRFRTADGAPLTRISECNAGQAQQLLHELRAKQQAALAREAERVAKAGAAR